jgi:MFS family permease
LAIPADVRTAIVGAYYPRALAVPDVARSRAQAGYGIASAIAAALVAAGVFGDLASRTGLVQTLGISALVAWLVAAGLYLLAVSRPFVPTTAEQNSADDFIRAALNAASTERDKIDYWQKRAAAVSAAAAVITVAALIAALVDTPSDSKTATFTLTANGLAAVGAACGEKPTAMTGSVSPGDLEKEFVNLKLDAGLCGTEATVIAVPRGAVKAVAFNR